MLLSQILERMLLSQILERTLLSQNPENNLKALVRKKDPALLDSAEQRVLVVQQVVLVEPLLMKPEQAFHLAKPIGCLH